MANKRLIDFTVKSVPVAADILYLGDSADGMQESQSTIAQVASAMTFTEAQVNNLIPDLAGKQTQSATLDTVTAGTYAGSPNIVTVGTVAAGIWNGGIISGQFGGTGVANNGKTISLGGNVVTANALNTVGNFPLTLTTTASTNITFPTTGTLATTSQIPSFPLSGANGGTGTSNSGKSITLGGNLTTSGAYSLSINTSANTNINLPTSGTLLSSTNNLIDVGDAAVSFDNLAPTTLAGDLIVNTTSGNTRLGIGADTYVLTADSTQPTKMKWAANGGSSTLTPLVCSWGLASGQSITQTTNITTMHFDTPISDSNNMYNTGSPPQTEPWCSITLPGKYSCTFQVCATTNIACNLNIFITLFNGQYVQKNMGTTSVRLSPGNFWESITVANCIIDTTYQSLTLPLQIRFQVSSNQPNVTFSSDYTQNYFSIFRLSNS